jgi:hypothetical protein
MTTETITTKQGFPSDGLYLAENMLPGEFGLDVFLKLAATIVSGSPTLRFNFFTEFNGKPWAVDTDGKLFSNNGSGWDVRRNPGNSNGQGLITDQTGRLLYSRNQYLGKTADGSIFDDSFKDFGEINLDYRPADTYEDWVVFGNNNKLAVLNVTDDSWNAAAFEMPSGFTCRGVKSNRTGVLVAFNYQNRGVALLWDVRTLRSISEWIWFDHPIQSICKVGDGWCITTMKEQWLTNGYSLTRKLEPFPDTLLQSLNFSVLPAGTLYTEGRLLTANTDNSGLYTRHKSGLYILDLATNRYSLAVPFGTKANMSLGAVFRDSSARTYVSYTTTIPSVTAQLAELKNDTPTRAIAVVGPFGKSAVKKVAQIVSLELMPSALAQLLYQNTGENASATISVKIYNFRRQLWAWAVTSGTAAAADQLPVSGNLQSFNNAAVGDEVTILSGTNAGEVRHIASISGRNTVSEVWTLDSALPNVTEASVSVNVQPFQLVSKKTFTAANFDDLSDFLFDIKNRVRGRKYLVKILIESITGLPLTLQSVSLTYDEQGINKSD